MLAGSFSSRLLPKCELQYEIRLFFLLPKESSVPVLSLSGESHVLQIVFVTVSTNM